MPIRALILVWLLPFAAIASEEPSFRTEVLARLQEDAPDTPPTVAGTPIHAHNIILRMYQDEGYAPLWDKQAIQALAEALDNLQFDGLNGADYRFAAIDPVLRSAQADDPGPAQAAELDILMSEAFIRAIYNLYYGKADPQDLDPDINFVRSYDGEDPAPLLADSIREARIEDALEWTRPHNERYRWLKQGLAQYRLYKQNGGWQAVPEGKTLRLGDKNPRVSAVRRRLAVTGELSEEAAMGPGSDEFDEGLQAAVERFQKRHGIEADGAIGSETLAEMNVSVDQRIDQIRVNLERQRWIMHEAYDQFLVADIAGFYIYWVKDNEIIWEEEIQVGKEFTATPVFKGEISYMEINPTWTIPPGIINRSILPGLKKDPDYLGKKGYQLLTLEGGPLDPKEIDWNTIKGFPYIVRQPPGPNNALGLVKFMFPNPHFVFLHDTNHRELFQNSKRTFSSGCIRVRNPFDLAERLLADQDGWTREKLDQIVASGKTTRINLQNPMRIIIRYATAAVPSPNGQVRFTPDIYHRDAAVLAALDGDFRIHGNHR